MPAILLLRRGIAITSTPSLLLLSVAGVSLLLLLPTLAPDLTGAPPPPPPRPPRLKVFVADLPRSLKYGLFEQYWVLRGPDARLGSDLDADLRRGSPRERYPESPVIKQYSAEFWLLGDLETPQAERAAASVAERVREWEEADVVFVPFFATLSAEMELGWGGRKEGFNKREGNGDYARQREVVDRVKATAAWRRSGDRDHVFVLTAATTPPCAFLEGGHVREELWELLVNEPGIVMEEGFPNATGREQSIKGMQSSEFCLHPSGDTPTSCRLFDAVASLCIPVIVSDAIELPFEGIIDYSEFSVFVSVSNGLQPKWLVNHLRGISKQQRAKYRANIARVQPVIEYDNGIPSGIGPIPADGAVNHIWMKVQQKLPVIREAITRNKRKPENVSVPLRCHCTWVFLFFSSILTAATAQKARKNLRSDLTASTRMLFQVFAAERRHVHVKCTHPAE